MSKNLRGCFLKENKVNGKKDYEKNERRTKKRTRKSSGVLFIFRDFLQIHMTKMN